MENEVKNLYNQCGRLPARSVTHEETHGIPIENSPLLIEHNPQTGASRVRLRFWNVPSVSRTLATTSCNPTRADAKDQLANLTVAVV